MKYRKIQLIAGTTYSVSLPKEWVKEQNLRPQDAVCLIEEKDGSLRISTRPQNNHINDSIILAVEDYGDNIHKVMIASYYQGYDNIKITSKTKMQLALRSKIKEALYNMSGTEIVYEDHNTVQLKVLLDRNKLTMNHLIFRIGLILSSSISNIIEDFDRKDIKKNEEELDRIYHLLAKIVSISIYDHALLVSSGIKYKSYLLPYFMIAKKLENIGDSLYFLAKYLDKKPDSIKKILPHLKEIDKLIKEDVEFMVKRDVNIIKTMNFMKTEELKNRIKEFEDQNIKINLSNVIRYIADIREEVINIAFYKKNKL